MKQIFAFPVLLALAASPTLAADDIVVTATGTRQLIDSTGQSITLIDAAEIARRQLPDIAGLLATVPGVRVNRSGPMGGVTAVSIRGAETTQTLVLIDGMRAGDPSGIGDMFDFGNLMTGNIGHIEVLRGANAIAYGSQAIGGVVAVSSAVPADGVSATAEASGGYRDTWAGRAGLGYGSDSLRAAIGVAGFRTDGISGASEARGATERDGFRNIAVNARVDADVAPGVGVELRGWMIDSRLHYDSFFGPPADSADYATNRQWLGQAALTFNLFDGKFENRVEFGYHRLTRDYYFAPAPTADYGYVGESWRVSWQGVAHLAQTARLILGYDHDAPSYESWGFGTARASARLDSMHAIAVVEPADGLSLTAGVRYDHHNMFGGHTSFSADASYSFVPTGTRFRVAYGEGFKAPSLYQLTDSFSGNPDLRPERARSVEAGIDQQLGEAFSAFVTVFRRDTRSQINYDYTTFTYGNLDRTRATGVEAGFRARPSESLLLDVSYSHVNSRDRARQSANFGKRLPRRPADSLTASLDQTWVGGVQTGATVTLASASYDDTANAVRMPSYVVAGLRASMPVGPVELFGRIDNLFNETYETAYGYGTYGRSAFVGIRASM